MLKLLKTIFKAGDVTVKYPFKPLEVMPGFRGKPEHESQQCIACASCTMVCPANALTMETDPNNGQRIWKLNVGRCIFCGRCEEVCPTHAIILSENFELAVGNKQDFYQQAVFDLANCVCCHKPFAPQKEVDYAMALLKTSGVPADDVDALRDQFQTCPSCKRKLSTHSLKTIGFPDTSNKESV